MRFASDDDIKNHAKTVPIEKHMVQHDPSVILYETSFLFKSGLNGAR